LRTSAFIIALIFISVEVFGATYWIAPTGKTPAAGSETDPFGSIENALKQVGGGNTFIFKPGTYLGRQVTLLREHAGSPQKPTVLKSQQKYEATIHGSPGHGISVGDGCEWVIIDGFDIGGAKMDGVYANADHTVIRNCRIHNNAGQGIMAHGEKGVVIENNLIEYNGTHIQFDHGIYAYGSDFTFRNNVVRFNSSIGLHLYPRLANSTVESNLIYGNPRWGILVYSTPKIGSNRIINNTITLNGSGIVVKDPHNEIIVNNIVVDNTHWKFHKLETIENLSGDNFKGSNVDYNLCIPPSKKVGAQPHGLSKKPLFLDPMKGAFYLKKGSPAIGKGSKEYASARDFFNYPRPSDKSPDLGCFSYNESLLLPEARDSWYYQWPFFFKKSRGPIPDLWKPPRSKGQKTR